MHDLFGEQHDPGGKVRTHLLPGVHGDALFAGDRDEYRTVLRRWTGDDFPERFVLLVGMNPSTASHEKNDPTIAREWGFAVAWGYAGLAKVNVSPYRLTASTKLKEVQQALTIPDNIEVIMGLAAKADRIVMAHGKLPRPLQQIGAEVTSALRRLAVPLWCFAKNEDGSPKHPLYVKGDTALIPY